MISSEASPHLQRQLTTHEHERPGTTEDASRASLTEIIWRYPQTTQQPMKNRPKHPREKARIPVGAPSLRVDEGSTASTARIRSRTDILAPRAGANWVGSSEGESNSGGNHDTADTTQTTKKQRGAEYSRRLPAVSGDADAEIAVGAENVYFPPLAAHERTTAMP
jgi:hypothetical protein